VRLDRLPTAALFAAAIVLVVELIGVPIASHIAWPRAWLHSSPRTDDALRLAAQLELADTSERLVYVTGSSQGREDVDRELTHTLLADAGITDVQVWNLAVAGGDAIDAFLQLDAIVEKPPQLVLMVASWVFFYDSYDTTKLELYCTSLTRLRQVAHIYGPQSFWRDADGELSSAVLSNLVPSFRWARSYLSIDLVRSMLGEERSEPRWHAGYAQQGEEYFVRTLAKYGGRRHGVSLDTLRKRRALEAMARELRARDIELVIIEGPLHPRSAEMSRDFLVIWEDYITNMRLMSENLDFTYVEIDACGLADAELFNDFGHLNARGRQLFTECVTRDLLVPRLR